MINYRGFNIEVLPKPGFAARTWYFYRISGNGLKYPLESDMGEVTEDLAVNEAKEFIDEHLVATEPAA